LKKLHVLEAQTCALLADLDLACSGDIEERLGHFVASAMQRMPRCCTPEDIAAYSRCIAELRVDNFGATGARMMLRGLGIGDAPTEFSDRVASEHPQFGAGFGSIDRPSQFKIHAFAEYSVMTSGGGSVNGSLLRESGLNIGFGLQAPRWLRAVRLPINAHVERELCAEFQLLEALCEALASASAVAGASLDGSSNGATALGSPSCPRCRRSRTG